MNPIEICKQNLSIINDLVNTLLRQIGERPLSRENRQEIDNFTRIYKNFSNSIKSSTPDVEALIVLASYSAIHAHSLGMKISRAHNFSDEIRVTARALEEKASQLREIINSSEAFSEPYMISSAHGNSDGSLSENDSVSSQEKNIIELQTKLRSEIETFERDIAKGNNEIEELKRKSSESSKKSLDEVSNLNVSIERLKSEILELKNNLIKEVGKAEKIAEGAQERSKEVDSQINGLLGQNASKILLIDYANTAELEGKSANALRGWSLACMALTGIILCLALYESLSSGLDWKQAIFKVFTAIALSVPAAYLARESAKHRSQEHVNRRISMDLRAITPYIATLPGDEQNKIKSEVASRIFGVQENGGINSDNYPVNVQELAKMIIDKIPAPKP
ncbi:hypothetical protein IQK56_17640 [Pseudomonas sp. MAFF 301449]|uniref:Chromosome partition protein Smc n=1 Tax=Pseudomonas cyclaminis TaxID=2781239 RepID=A0ABR9SUK2_9PSED|nr:hypothetical protein [Pseudomonas cyclaminis]MBE8592604.1 hypothetical protein [Pseudomonas cyclaminis]MBE8600091.1 hypothetical protein [Pseudomonas cyclaminis]